MRTFSDDSAPRVDSARTLSTDDVPERERFAYWREICTKAFVDLRSERKSNAPFFGSIRHRRLGEVGLAHVASVDQTVIRDSRSIARDTKDIFFVNLQLDGSSTFRQGGDTIALARGDFALVDATQPFELGLPGPFLHASFKIERARLVPRLRDAAGGGRVVRAGTALGALVSAFLRDVATAELTADDGAGLSPQLLGMVALAFERRIDAAAARTDVREAVRRRACRLIESWLADPSLAPPTIARALHVSPRYLHMCFAPSGESLMAYVLRMRLERCRAELARADMRGRSVSEIAFAWGFSDLSHFGRAFKAAYGMTPRDCRAASAR